MEVNEQTNIRRKGLYRPTVGQNEDNEMLNI